MGYNLEHFTDEDLKKARLVMLNQHVAEKTHRQRTLISSKLRHYTNELFKRTGNPIYK